MPADKKISALSAVTPTSDDFIAVVDNADLTVTKKATLANLPVSTATQTALDSKVDKVTGKGLSANDYTTTEKNKLAGIEAGAQVNVVGEAPVDGKQYARKNAAWSEVVASGGGSSLWTSVTGTRTGNTTFTVTGDQTATFSRGLVIKWTESSAVKCGYVVSSSFSSVTTVTIIGDTMSSIDSSSLKYTAIPAQTMKFAVAGSIGATGTNVANTQRAEEALRVLGANLWVATAGTTNSTTIDLNKAGTTMFTTKPTLASTVAYSSIPFTADSGTSLAIGDAVTEDVDAVQTTAAVDLYSSIIVFPTRILNLA